MEGKECPGEGPPWWETCGGDFEAIEAGDEEWTIENERCHRASGEAPSWEGRSWLRAARVLGQFEFGQGVKTLNLKGRRGPWRPESRPLHVGLGLGCCKKGDRVLEVESGF